MHSCGKRSNGPKDAHTLTSGTCERAHVLGRDCSARGLCRRGSGPEDGASTPVSPLDARTASPGCRGPERWQWPASAACGPLCRWGRGRAAGAGRRRQRSSPSRSVRAAGTRPRPGGSGATQLPPPSAGGWKAERRERGRSGPGEGSFRDAGCRPPHTSSHGAGGRKALSGFYKELTGPTLMT